MSHRFISPYCLRCVSLPRVSEFLVSNFNFPLISARVSSLIGGLDKLQGMRIKMTQDKKRDLGERMRLIKSNWLLNYANQIWKKNFRLNSMKNDAQIQSASMPYKVSRRLSLRHYATTRHGHRDTFDWLVGEQAKFRPLRQMDIVLVEYMYMSRICNMCNHNTNTDCCNLPILAELAPTIRVSI